MVKALRSCLEAAKGKIKAGHLILRKSPKRTATGSSTASNISRIPIRHAGSATDWEPLEVSLVPISAEEGWYFVFAASQCSQPRSHDPGFFRITGKKYFVLYRSQAKNISYSTSDGLGRGIF